MLHIPASPKDGLNWCVDPLGIYIYVLLYYMYIIYLALLTHKHWNNKMFYSICNKHI